MKRSLFFFLGLVAAIVVAMVSEAPKTERQLADNREDTIEANATDDETLITDAAGTKASKIKRENK